MKLEELSALELGKLVNRKVVSPTEVMSYFIKRIEERNPSINAIVDKHYDEAMEDAKVLEDHIMNGYYGGLLAGVPIGLKDFLPTKKGWKSSHGGVKSLITVDDADSEFYKVAKEEGAIAIGKTNAPSFGFRGTTDNKMYGPTSTPFNTAYNSGGSSGGSCAAVSDGLVGLAEVGDAGGSGRIPAAWCGCVGYKPSAGLVPSISRPDAWTATHPYCCGGPAGRTVEDIAVVVEQMQRFDPRDPLSVPLRQKRYDPNNIDLKDLKICYTMNFDLFPVPEDDIVTSIYSAVQLLRSEGNQIDEVEFNFNHSRLEMEWAWLLGISIDDAATPFISDKVSQNNDDVPLEFLRWHERAKKINICDYRMFHEIRTDILDAHQDIFDNYDIILAPVTGCLPVRNQEEKDNTFGPDFIGGEQIDSSIGFGYTYLENMIGTPAMSVPAGLSKEGLPIGIQIIGKRYFDEDVFKVAYALEKINPWNYDIPFGRRLN